MAKKHDAQLELDEDVPLEKLTETLQRIGWGVLILLLGLALAGLFGSGPLSRAVSRSESGAIQLSYDRFDRRLMDGFLQVLVRSGKTVHFHRSYLEHAEIKGIQPPPAAAQATGDEIAYSFAADLPGPLEVEFRVKLKNKTGIARGSIRAGEEAVSFRQLIFP